MNNCFTCKFRIRARLSSLHRTNAAENHAYLDDLLAFHREVFECDSEMLNEFVAELRADIVPDASAPQRRKVV